MIPVYPYQTRAVRDLAWACFSPPMLHAQQLADDGQNVADCGLALTPARRLALEQLDRDATPLLAHLAQRPSHRLGIYFEQLWHFFLASDPDLELIAHNLPVQDNGRTLGEFDCIYYCRERRRHFHLELAVKFFLGYRQETRDEPASHWHEWLGPNTDDRLDRKIAQLFQRQIRLGDTVAGRRQLATLGISQLAREVQIQGCLFQPASDPLPPPFGFNPEHRLGRWLSIGQLEPYLEALGAERFQLLHKIQWLGPAPLNQLEPVYSRATLAKSLHSHFTTSSRARLVAAMGPADVETSRFFVTPVNWPGNIEPPAR